MCDIPKGAALVLNRLIEMRDRMFLHVLPRGYQEQQETPAEKRQRKQAIQLIRKYEANRHG